MALQLQMVKYQEAPMPQIPWNVRSYKISEPWADPPSPVAYRVMQLKSDRDPQTTNIYDLNII